MRQLVFFLLFLMLCGGCLAVAGCSLFNGEDSPWSPASPQTRQAFEAGFDAHVKRYYAEAEAHFRRTLELDPSYVAAKVFLLQYVDDEERSQLLAELRAVDLETVTPRERFLVSSWLGWMQGRPEDAEAAIAHYREEKPDDPYGLIYECDVAWEKERWREAEDCYQRMLTLHPSWVIVSERLGLLDMAHGRFSEAEEHFRTYRFIAPDQANPYDALGNLLILLGRYEEAGEMLEEALRIKPDFCLAYPSQIRLFMNWGRYDRAEATLHELQALPVCEELFPKGYFCRAEIWLQYLRSQAEDVLRIAEEGCLEANQGFDLIAHRAALMLGRSALAQEMEAQLDARLASDEVLWPIHRKILEAQRKHMEGVRALFSGRLDTAAQRLQEADDLLPYWGYKYEVFKLFNRLTLARALELAGRPHEGAAVRKQIEAVNPRIAARFPMPELDGLAAVMEPTSGR